MLLNLSHYASSGWHHYLFNLQEIHLSGSPFLRRITLPILDLACHRFFLAWNFSLISNIFRSLISNSFLFSAPTLTSLFIYAINNNMIIRCYTPFLQWTTNHPSQSPPRSEYYFFWVHVVSSSSSGLSSTSRQDYFLGHTMLYYSDILGFSLLSIPFLRSIPSLKSFSGLCIFLKMTSPLLRSVPCLLSKPPLRSTPLLRSHCVLLFGTWFVYENSRLSMPTRLPPLSISPNATVVILKALFYHKQLWFFDGRFVNRLEPTEWICLWKKPLKPILRGLKGVKNEKVFFIFDYFYMQKLCRIS